MPLDDHRFRCLHHRPRRRPRVYTAKHHRKLVDARSINEITGDVCDRRSMNIAAGKEFTGRDYRERVSEEYRGLAPVQRRSDREADDNAFPAVWGARTIRASLLRTTKRTKTQSGVYISLYFPFSSSTVRRDRTRVAFSSFSSPSLLRVPIRFHVSPLISLSCLRLHRRLLRLSHPPASFPPPQASTVTTATTTTTTTPPPPSSSVSSSSSTSRFLHPSPLKARLTSLPSTPSRTSSSRFLSFSLYPAILSNFL